MPLSQVLGEGPTLLTELRQEAVASVTARAAGWGSRASRSPWQLCPSPRTWHLSLPLPSLQLGPVSLGGPHPIPTPADFERWEGRGWLQQTRTQQPQEPSSLTSLARGWAPSISEATQGPLSRGGKWCSEPRGQGRPTGKPPCSVLLQQGRWPGGATVPVPPMPGPAPVEVPPDIRLVSESAISWRPHQPHDRCLRGRRAAAWPPDPNLGQRESVPSVPPGEGPSSGTAGSRAPLLCGACTGLSPLTRDHLHPGLWGL